MNIKQSLMMVIFMVLLHISGAANANDLAVGIANEHIDVTVGFTGSSIELFGDRRNTDADIVIIVEGPRKDITVWSKARVMGTWVNRYYMTFQNMPAYYHFASTIAVESDDDNLDLIMRHNGIGHAALFSSKDVKKSRAIQDVKAFQNAFLKKKQKKGVYFEKPAEIKFINDNFFRVRFDFPASALTGEYKIHSLLIEDGKVSEQHVDTLIVEQVGLNAYVYKLAKNHSFVYALTCILLALFCGWFASVVRVRP